MAPYGIISPLDIAMLRLTEDNMIYSDGVACVQAYWAYSMDLSQSERDDMRSLILGCKYRHTAASREAFSAHRLCRDPFGTTRPGLILLRVLYKAVPVDFENSIVARFGRLPVRNRSDEYFALFPNTVGPPVFEMDMSRVRLYHLRYPLLKVTPSTCRKRQEVVVPAPQETLSPTTSPTMSATDIGSEASTLAPSTPTRNEDLGHKTPDLNTALNNNQNALAQTTAILESMLQQPLGPNERPMETPVNLEQPPSAATTKASRPVTRQEFDQLCAEVTTIKSEVTTIKSEVTTIKSEVSTLAENVSMLRRAFERQRQQQGERRERRRLWFWTASDQEKKGSRQQNDSKAGVRVYERIGGLGQQDR